MNELKPEDVMKALESIVQRYLMPNVDIDGTVTVENAERWFLHLLKEHLAPCVSALLREKDAEIERLASRVSMLHEIELSYALQYGDAIDKDIARKQLRAEAITEFAELWKKWWYGQIQVGVNAYQESIIYDAIDQIAKEMKGETDEN